MSVAFSSLSFPSRAPKMALVAEGLSWLLQLHYSRRHDQTILWLISRHTADVFGINKCPEDGKQIKNQQTKFSQVRGTFMKLSGQFPKLIHPHTLRYSPGELQSGSFADCWRWCGHGAEIWGSVLWVYTACVDVKQDNIISEARRACLVNVASSFKFHKQ